jgi:hypothetical protein
MNIGELFDRQQWAKQLARRARNFRVMCEHAGKFQGGVVIETGTAWDEGNWEGQGQSTIVWDWLAGHRPGLEIHSIDIRPEAIETAQTQTSRITFHCGDSPKVLNSLSDDVLSRCCVLYLDSFDWTPQLNIQSSMHHLGELCAVWAKLPKGCLIAVDDRHGNDAGKHLMVEAFMKCLGYEPIFKNHQIGWIK